MPYVESFHYYGIIFGDKFLESRTKIQLNNTKFNTLGPNYLICKYRNKYNNITILLVDTTYTCDSLCFLSFK